MMTVLAGRYLSGVSIGSNYKKQITDYLKVFIFNPVYKTVKENTSDNGAKTVKLNMKGNHKE